MLYVKKFSHLWQYLSEFFLEWEMCLIKFVETIETHFMFNNYLSGNSAAHEVIRKNMVQTERPQMTIHHGACALHARSVSLHAPCTCQSTRETTHTRTHRHTFPHTHETCQHKHAYTHSNMISTAFPLQQCFRERTSVLHIRILPLLLSVKPGRI